jgi:hypothetical protein
LSRETTKLTLDAGDGAWENLHVGTLLQDGGAIVKVVAISRPYVFVERLGRLA